MLLPFTIVNSPLKSCFDTVTTMFGIEVPSYANNVISNINSKYEILGVHYLEGIQEVGWAEVILRVNMQNHFTTLLSLTNNLKEISSIPISDSIKKTIDHNGDTFSMSENQPIDATETITTPYIKVKGRNGYQATDTTEHNTVEEAKMRNELTERVVYNLSMWLENMLQLVLEEYSTMY